MPDQDGWHDGPAVLVEGRAMRWHYCEGAETDTLVADIPRERAAHLRECRKRRRSADERARAQRIRAARMRLRELHKLRRENKLAAREEGQ